MTVLGTNAVPDEPAGLAVAACYRALVATCNACRDLPAVVRLSLGTGGAEEPPKAVAGFERCGRLLHCPSCGTLYTDEEEWDHDHFIPSGTRVISRLDTDEARRKLATAGPGAERWRAEAGYGAFIAALAGRAASGGLAEADATALASHQLREKAETEVAALLRHPAAAVREGALKAVAEWDGLPAGPIAAATAELLADPKLAPVANNALLRSPGSTAVTPALPAIIDRLDDPDAKARGYAIDLVLHHLRAYSSKAAAGVADYGPGTPRRLEASLDDVLARLPAIVRHVASPRRAKRKTTRQAADQVLCVLAADSDASARRAWDELVLQGQTALREFGSWLTAQREQAARR